MERAHRRLFNKNKKAGASDTELAPTMACPGRFELPVFRIGIYCIIQLCYGQRYGTDFSQHIYITCKKRCRQEKNMLKFGQTTKYVREVPRL